ncbi:AAA family ATPase [Streptomyces sp. NL15-2K]|uniref:ATP-binding protein n=1 Tax=Streptomyces sp. NL15-2K TaxID=376149 RepID=UPI00155AAD59|nr:MULTISPECIES: AAA family ATPase [Actinomycetes]WKX13711.1 AAA family ATPase [Kutzneria buriramensis]
MLLERDGELSAVSEALRSAHRGSGSLLVISGPLGIGKSELLRALPGLAARQGTWVLSAGASALEQDYAFGVMRQLLEPALFAADDKTRERWLSGAAGLAEMVLGQDLFDVACTRPVSVRQAVLLGLLKLVERLSAAQTLMILVDGFHWADEPSLQWLARLANRLNRLRILVVVTVRDGEPTSNRPTVQAITKAAARVLRPRPFSLAGTRALVADQWGEAGHEEFALACHETTNGNPLFLTSVLLNLSVNGIAPRAEHADKVRSLRPAELRDRLIDCIGAQTEPVRDVAKAMAIVGDQADPEVIGQIAGLDAVGCAEAMDVLHMLGLLADRQRPGFVHLVVQDAVEESMTAEEREKLHIRAAKSLYGGEHSVEQRAAQLLAVTSPQGQWTADVLRAAAGRALRRGAPEAASRYLRRALLDTSTNGEDRARLLVELGTVERAFDVRASVRHINHALPLLSSAQDRAAAMVRLAPALLGSAPPGVRTPTRQVFDELGDMGELSGADRELKLRIEARMRHLDCTDPLELADDSTRLAELGGDPPVDTLAERELVTTLLFAVTLTSRRPSSWVARVAERIVEREPASSSHAHTALPLLVTVLAAAESTGRLTPWLDTSLAHAGRRGAVVEQAVIRTEQAVVALHTGRIADAKRAATDAFELGALEWDTANPTTAIAMAAVASGVRDVELTRNVLTGCGTETTNACLASVLHLMRGTLATAEGDLRVALEQYQECGRQLSRASWNNPVLFPWRALTADLYRRLGDLDAAREVAEEDGRLAAEWGAPAALGRAKRILGDVIGGEAGIVVLRESVDILEGSVNALELARSLLRLGISLREQGHPEAVAHLRRSHRLALDCGDPRLAERAQASATEAASRQPGRPSLTRTELRVARLAAAGDTNHDIARLLGVSRRAVEKHLTNCYRKLGIHRRDELVDVLPPAGSDRGPGTTEPLGRSRPRS